jgi:hypothetical protein
MVKYEMECFGRRHDINYYPDTSLRRLRERPRETPQDGRFPGSDLYLELSKYEAAMVTIRT